MNNELGIVQLEYLHAAAKANLHEPGMAALYEALDMAIEALRSSEPKTADSGSADSEMPEVKTDRTTSGDLISRQDAINAFEPDHSQDWYTPYIIEKLESLPSAQPEVLACGEGELSAQPEVKPISYTDCANAMLMMWIDEVLTDGEYNRIMDKLNAHEMEKRNG